MEVAAYMAFVLLFATPPVCLGLSVLFTALHTAEEVFGGGGPFWSYYADHFGPRLPDWAGYLAFASLAVVLALLAWLGYGGDPLALGLLAGLRLGDALFSHFGLQFLVLRDAENPGVATTPLYVVESLWVLALWPASAAAFLVGVFLFGSWWVVSFQLLRSESRCDRS